MAPPTCVLKSASEVKSSSVDVDFMISSCCPESCSSQEKDTIWLELVKVRLEDGEGFIEVSVIVGVGVIVLVAVAVPVFVGVGVIVGV